jgi:predicted TIM-barrel fold metal-dependent hydrolase
MIFDANAFLGKWPYWPVQCTHPEEIATALNGLRIERAAMCSTRSVFVNWEDGNREVEAAAAHHAEFVPFACLGTQELSHAWHPAQYDFAGYAARGFRGIRLYPQHHSYHLLFESFVDVILEDAASRGWPVVLPLRILMNWGVPSLEPPVMQAIVTRHPHVRWILAGVNYLHELQMAVSLMQRYETVHLETSCIMGYAAIEKTVQRCGQDRLLFGSGMPWQEAAAGLSKITHARISTAAHEAILGENLLRLIGETAS